ncbi:MAG: electron transport complex subunit RsxC [Clostridia bacterium]|nr:electron transport complex subunit RsxC [Clostridia bacterium]
MVKRMNGVHVPHYKNTADCAPNRMPVPAQLVIPMAMHIGAKANPVVKPGDTVKVGQLIAEAGGFVSAPIYSGVSGTVKKIEDVLVASGQKVPAVIIESDGQQEVYEGVKPPEVTDLESFINAVRDSGSVGLGGAGFPTSVKLKCDLDKIDAVIVNGAECEPFITSDTRTMLDRADEVYDALKLIEKYMLVKKIIIGIEDNKPECIENFRNLCKDDPAVTVQALPSSYPQGGEKVLIFNTIGRIVPEGKLPLDAGAIVLNCTTLATIGRYVKTGMPLVEKCVTVDGSAVANPQNVIAPIGTPLKDIFEFTGGFKEDPYKVLYGGPMMGLAVPSLDSPLLKNTNAVLAFNQKDATPPEPTPCIKCGRCIAACPLQLMPAEIQIALNKGDVEDLKALKVNLCMECGCCTFVCPAKRPLGQNHKLGKAMVMKAKQEADAKAKAEAEKKAAAEAAAKEKEV